MAFRKISARDKIFIEVKSKFENVYLDFKEFANMLTVKAGNSKKTSGKADSYARYFVRLIILYEENFSEEIDMINNDESIEKLEKLRELGGFRKYNIEEGRFPNATLVCFRKYVTSKNLEQKDL